MSKKGSIEVFQTKITRNDRFAQMSHQEKVIEQKKKEIQAKLEQKQKGQPTSVTETKNVPIATAKTKSPAKLCDKKHGFNIFSNDGSFLDQFKQMKDKKVEHKLRLYKNKEGHDKSYRESLYYACSRCAAVLKTTPEKLERVLQTIRHRLQLCIETDGFQFEQLRSDDYCKISRWSQKRGSQSPKDGRGMKPRTSRFSDKINFEPKINITYGSLISQSNFDPISPQNVTGQPLLKNLIAPPGVMYPTPQTNESVIGTPSVLLNMAPPQIVQNSIAAPIVVSSTTSLLSGSQNIENVITPTTVLTTVTLPSSVAIPSQNATVLTETSLTTSVIGIPPCVPSIELASIPPPTPIQVHNIPQPEPINTLTIPSPAPIQVQNIPPPSPIQLNEIPNPKPLDIVNIPTPTENNCVEKSMSNPDFIKNIPPPNKSVPPPTLSEPNLNVNISVPPPTKEVAVGPTIPTCLPPPNVIPPTSMPPPSQTLPPQPQNISQNILIQNVPPPTQNILVQGISPSQPLTQLTLQSLAAPPPPPPLPQVTQNLIQISQSAGNIGISATIPLTVPIQNQVPATLVGVPPPPVTVTNSIPSLMAQPVLPPPGMGVAPTININCPPPLIQNTASCSALQGPPPTFVNQPPPLTNQIPPMHIPPPGTLSIGQASNVVGTFSDMNSVFLPGTADYEAMASLGRMVAQCGRGIEDIVRQRKTQDPRLWFLFHKESAAYHQYEQLVEHFKIEMGKDDNQKKDESFYKPEDTYEPEIINDEKMNNSKYNQEEKDSEKSSKRKRKSRWGDKDASVHPPILIVNTPPTLSTASVGEVKLLKVTRNDPTLIHYAINTFGSANLNEEDWKKVEDHFKINMLYQEMLRKRQEVENLKLAGKNKYEYDSDEEIDGGTWEHKLREKEMIATQQWANELNRQAEGKHHIGDYLPPDELQKFLEKSTAVKEGRQPSLSDYKEFKLKEDNIGFKMLQKLGWSEGQGLGSNGSGIIEPVNKGTLRDQNQGLGLEQMDEIGDADDEYESYRKRMMLAYRFRPNPLNNPRRPYY